MRRCWTVPVAAVIGSLAAFGVTSIASAAPSRPGITTAQAFIVLAHATSFKMINVGGKGIGPGDYVVERWALRRGGALAGPLNDQCTIKFSQAPSHPAALCSFAFTLSGRGEITADGSVVFAPAPEGFRPVPFALPVTGGTGKFQDARGQIHVKFLGVADARFAFHLIA
jgi:hypothetical protein